MNVLRFGSQLLRSSPVGIILGGTALALAVPPIRQGLRTVAVAAVGVILSITDEAKRVTSASRESMEDIISEAKDPDTCCPSCSDFTQSAADLRKQPRRLAVAATMGALTVSDKAKSLYKDASDQFKSLVDEAKTTKVSSDPPETDIQENESHHHSSESDDLEFPKH